MEASSVKDLINHDESDVPGTEKRSYQKPELTKHQKLSEITLGIQCGGSVPLCSPVQVPFY